MFSKACEYAIRSVIFIAEQSLEGRKVSLKDVSQAIDSPEAYNSKILQQLTKQGIIHSDKGPTGGFSMGIKELETVTLSRIVHSIDGDNIYRGCGLGLKQCSEEMPCPVHDRFRQIRDDLRIMLENTTVKALALGMKDGLTFLRR